MILAPGRGRRLLWLAAYGVAMGLLEAAVVVYLRELFYPAGFRFPLVTLPVRLAAIEVLREATTVVMLGSVALLAGRDLVDRFFVFAFLFGCWDLVYYAGLRIFLRWPESLWTWDILFLIPVPWVGPVLFPILVSTFLVAGFLAHEIAEAQGKEIRPRRGEWVVAAAGALTIVASFCWRSADAFVAEPGSFPTALFLAGLVVAAIPFVRAGLRGRSGH